jgi:hypothetical protein
VVRARENALQIMRLPLMGDVVMDLRATALMADAACARVVIAEKSLDCASRPLGRMGSGRLARLVVQDFPALASR